MFENFHIGTIKPYLETIDVNKKKYDIFSSGLKEIF